MPHADHCVCVVGGHIYAIGGRDYKSELDWVERYDPVTNTWEFVSPMKKEVRVYSTAPYNIIFMYSQRF